MLLFDIPPIKAFTSFALDQRIDIDAQGRNCRQPASWYTVINYSPGFELSRIILMNVFTPHTLLQKLAYYSLYNIGNFLLPSGCFMCGPKPAALFK